MGNSLTKAALLDVAIQLAGCAIACKLQTEKYYDVTGSVTFILLTIQSIVNNNTFFPRQVIQSSLVCVWALRLGLFLFLRMLRDAKDVRFDKVRKNPKIFFLYWMVQALWIFVTLCPTLILNTKQVDKEFTVRDYVGWTLWGTGLLLECAADYQKYTFRCNPANKDKWITSGVWSIVRHPNYLGEIMLWIGHFISTSSTFNGWENLTVLSPLFVAAMLTKVSGIPLLERRALKRWKDNPQYMSFIRNTYRLIPYIY